jgi:hypothetical protein
MKLIAWVVAGVLGMGLATARADDPPLSPADRAADGDDGDDAPAPPARDDEAVVPPSTDGRDEPDAPDVDEPAPPPHAPRAPAPPHAPPRGPRSHHRARLSVTPRSHLAHGQAQGLSEDDGDARLDKQEDTVLGGKHFRIKTARGAVHVWVPPGYDRETAGTVIYVHGYYTDADGAWREHDLARQFKASRQNAMFIVPDAPAGNDDEVRWPALKDLRRAVTRANIHLPDGPVVVMGHSGAFRTVMQWVDHRLVDQIILLDALYAGEAAFDEYIASGKRADDHKLIVVAASTAEESSSFARRYKFAVARERMPSEAAGFSRRERTAKLLYIRSQFDHMAIVTGGRVIAVLLRVTPLKAL